jgi:phage terminase small subunit
MAGVKGQKGGGGKREGAGRKPAPIVAPEPANDSLDFLRGVMNDVSQKPELRVRAAITIAQYEHAKPGEGGKKESRAEAAKFAGEGKFGAGGPPRLVSIRP